MSARQNVIAKWVKSRHKPKRVLLTSDAVDRDDEPPSLNVRWELT